MKAKQNTIKIHVTLFYVQIDLNVKKIFLKNNGIFF